MLSNVFLRKKFDKIFGKLKNCLYICTVIKTKFFDRRFEKLTYFQGYSLYKSIEAAWTLGTNIEFWLHRMLNIWDVITYEVVARINPKLIGQLVGLTQFVIWLEYVMI